jgi:isocitrate lyase
VPTLVLARTDAEAADLLTSDCDANDKPFVTGERTAEGFYRPRTVSSRRSARGRLRALRRPGVVRDRHAGSRFAREFAEAVQAKLPGKLLAYNCSPSFNWKKNLDDKTIAKFQRRTRRDGLQVPVHHPGRHPQHVVPHVRLARPTSKA